MNKSFTPARFALFVEIPGEQAGQTKRTTYRHRIGNYKTLEDAKSAAKTDADVMGRSGSLNVLLGIPTSSRRVYRIFEATDFREVSEE